MSRNGSGVYSLYPGVNPTVTGTTITSSWANNTLSDIATALTASIANDGQTPILANLPMATFRHTGVGNSVARTDYSATGQVQDSTFLWGGTAGGTADALTITLAPAITAYAAGQCFEFIVGASPNATTTPTLAVNGLPAITFKRKNGSAIVAGDLAAGDRIIALHDGTNFRLGSISPVAPTFSGNTTVTTINKVTITTPATAATLTLADGSTLVTSGAYSTTLTATAATNVTLPTTGTLATLAGSEELTNKTLNASVGKGTWTASGTWTLPAFTAGGAITGSDSQVTRAMLIDYGYTVVDKGNSSTTTQTYDYTAGSVQTSTATGNHTIAISNWPPTGNLGEILIIGTNFGAYTITFPSWTWIKPDGTTTTSIATYLAANTGRTALQTSGVDQIMIWSRDGGTTVYAKLV